MADYEELIPALKKLLTKSEGEVPAVADSALAKAPKSPEVVGEGTSKASPSEPEVKDAEVASQQAPVGPDQAQLEDKSSDSTPSLSDRWAKLKSLAPYAGAAGAGVAADVAMEGGNKTTQQASTPVVPPNSKAAPATSDDDDEKLLSDLQNQYEPDNKIASKAAVAPKSANASDDDSSDDKSTPSTPYTSSANAFSNQRLAELQDRANKLQALNNLARGMTNAVATAGQTRNLFDKQFEDQGKQIAQMPDQYITQAAAQKMDPNSPGSKAARNLAQYIDPDMKITPNMSAADLEKIIPQMANISTSEDAQDVKLEIAKERVANARNNATMLALKAQDVKDQKQLNTYNQTVQQLESTRTSSPAVQQAEKDVYSAQKVRSLINSIGGGDPGKLSPQNMHLLISEVNKMASGGQGTDMGLQHLTPDTFQGELATAWQRVVNHPVAANAAAFAKQFVNYADDMGERGKQVIKDRYGRIINSRASQFSPDQLSTLTQQYINRFDDPDDKVTKLAKQQAAQVVQDDNKAKSDVAASAPQQPSAPSLQNAAAIEKARRAALKAQQAQQGGQ